MTFDKTDEIRELGALIKSFLNIQTFPVGVKFLESEEFPSDAVVLNGTRYCQALMKARNGEKVILDGKGISCPAAASAFGFRPLPESLKSGKGLVGFGIVSDPEVGKRMFEEMPRIEPGKIRQIYLFPLEKADESPDIVIVEDDPEKLMWLALAYMHDKKGERLKCSTAVLQATCVDSTIIPFIEQRLNYVLGCYGCRDATDLGEAEAIIGFPGSVLPNIVEHLEYLNEKAIPRSRSKGAFKLLQNHNPEKK
jgi:uncharacterized protein (DUF169 family)